MTINQSKNLLTSAWFRKTTMLQEEDASLLTVEEKTWLNEYHALVFEKLSPRLNEKAKAWLANKVIPL